MTETREQKIPLLVIVGPTASGKSALAERLAADFNGVIINADARQMYQGIEIISAAPEVVGDAELYSWKSVDEPYSFAEYVHDADAAIARVFKNGKLPIIVGGTGLYVDALVQRFVPPPVTEKSIRDSVAALSKSAALEKLEANDPMAFSTIDIKNPRRVQRALEVFLQTGESITSFGATSEDSPYDVCWIGWTVEREELRKRIAQRVDDMWKRGAVAEIKKLLESGHTKSEPGMLAIGVSEIIDYICDVLDEQNTKEKIVARTYQYARRQLTWFRRNEQIVWYNSVETVCHSVQNFLQQHFKK
ncbi:MAG: tRNA (adenosine(37)-N6)-dimethylallyltransferase MiaA [Candidatus Magasanikbacteria bacterium]|nr:tRNA (adenosine(37)-N6)-dimethylallyltransferase MiaA [Candidatus Magasanikbacteria bacterium]